LKLKKIEGTAVGLLPDGGTMVTTHELSVGPAAAAAASVLLYWSSYRGRWLPAPPEHSARARRFTATSNNFNLPLIYCKLAQNTS